MISGPTLILVASLALQLVAAGVAIRLIFTTRALWAWVLVASALVLMASRRAVTLIAVLDGTARIQLSAELIALAISVCLVAGMALIGPVFRRMREIADDLGRREGELRALIDAAPEGVALVRDGGWVYLNKALLARLGLTAAPPIGQRVTDLVHPDDVVASEALFRGGDTDSAAVVRDVRLRGASGEDVAFDLAWGPALELDGAAAHLLLTRDLTERKKLDSALVESSKMEAVARLSGGIAHDFNNLLTVILASASLARSRGAEVGEQLGLISDAATRAARLTAQLLSFSRQQPVQPVAFDLCAMVRDDRRMLESLLGESIRVVMTCAAGPVVAFADRGQVEQVVINLALNARDAMPDGGELELTVRGEPSALPGGAALLAVRDTGVGMDDQVRRRVFDPFFTTKPTGKGTGLGLASAYGIVRAAGGRLEVESAPGAGSVFRAYLPLAPAGTAVGPSALAAADLGARARPDESILVVDDDALLRAVVVRVLTGLGYRVEAAADGTAALAVLQAMPLPSLLVTDVVMPGMTGVELARRARALHPTIRILLTTGYGDEVLGADRGGETWSILAKPYDVATLGQRVRTELDA